MKAMGKITCMIIDDEPPALDLLERYIAKTPFIDCLFKCSSALEAMEILEDSIIDLIFLDIQMPELTGIEFSRIIGKDIKIIFTTAFDEYALDGYKVNAIDYLLKPFNYEEFLRATTKAKEWFELKKVKDKFETIYDKNFIFVKSEYKKVKIPLKDVLYFEGLKDYIKIWLTDKTSPILTLLSLKSLSEKLSDSMFMRIHRSFIISLDNIHSIERNQVIMKNDIRITIAEQYKKKFHKFVAGKSIGK